MAAPPLRDVYDCAVIGDGWAAALFANAFVRAGISTMLVAEESLRAVDAWLHPRLEQIGLNELPQMRSVRGIVVRDLAGEVVEVLRPNLLLPARSDVASPKDHVGLTPRRSPFENPSCIFEFVPRDSNRTAVGGIYRHVEIESGDEQFGHLFPTQLPGVVAWLAGCGQGLFSLGVIRAGDGNPIANSVSAAELFEEALVACPALTRRLARAQLVGELHWCGGRSRNSAPLRKKQAIVLPAYDAEIDPLFAGGYELATHCARELADLLVACRDVPENVHERITQWHAGWQETEQGIGNLVRYYYSCPPGRDRCPVGTVTERRESSPDFA